MTANTFLRQDATFAQVDYASLSGAPAITPPGLVYLSTLTASNSATLDDTTDITATYDEYLFVLRNVVPVTNNVALKMRVSTNGGSTWQATSYLSLIAGAFTTGLSGTGSAADGATDGILLTGTNTNLDGLGNAATVGVSGAVWLHSPNSTSDIALVTGQTTWLAQGSTRLDVGSIGGSWNSTGAAINAVRFLMTSGNISSGTIKVYGLKTS